MKIVVGLGNPGIGYEKTRHNFGFMFLEYLENKYKFRIEKKKLDSLIGECTINDEKVVFVKPSTFMNLSGEAVQKVKNWYKVEDKDIIIIFDDIDIEFGEIRYRSSGSGGSHNGMKNIVQMLSTENIARIKLRAWKFKIRKSKFKRLCII
jgi:PTH1 family peptidyl-tRNA hydrolase